jgi:hypothetical protein
MVGYKTRFIKQTDAGELVNLYHLARVPLSGVKNEFGRYAGRYERSVWAASEFHKLHPEISHTAAYKDLEGLLA